jgi:hypothetical protein
MRAAVEDALAAASMSTAKLDGAAVALARRYASDIDEARVLSVAADKLMRETRAWLEPATYDRLVAQMARIEETAVLATLGPKLQSVLHDLGLTPRSRVERDGKEGNGGSAGTPRNDLAAWRTKRDQRQHAP